MLEPVSARQGVKPQAATGSRTGRRFAGVARVALRDTGATASSRREEHGRRAQQGGGDLDDPHGHLLPHLRGPEHPGRSG